MDKPPLFKTWDELWAWVPGDGWLTEPEGELLYRAAGATEGPILEVGCYKGKSTCLLASLGRPVYAVDPFAGFDPDEPTGKKALVAFWDNLLSRQISVGEMAPGPSYPCHVFFEAAGQVDLYRIPVGDWLPRPCGFAYLDGDHTYDGTAEQLAAAEYAGATEVCVHDYNDSGDGLEVKRAVKDEGWGVVERVERMAHCRRKTK